MTKDVVVSISGLQYEVSEEEAVEVISRGEYYYRNNKHFIKYEEMIDEGGTPGPLVNCLLKISRDKIEMIKKGASNVHMIFEQGKSHMTFYSTPYGDLMMGVNTKSIEITEEDTSLIATLTYGLDINYEHLSDCVLSIKVYSNTHI